MSEESRLRRLFDRYVEHHVEHGTALSTAELCRDDTELTEALQQLIHEYHQLDRSLSPHASLEIGESIGPYRVVDELGSGGMGRVYRASDLKLGRTVAIKVLHPELAADPERLRRFEHEARAASAFNHPNIVTIYDIDWHAGAPYIAMEYVDGLTLRQLMKSGRLTLETSLDYAIQIADGLARAHSQGLVHRDLKPDNVMVTGEGLVKILDFGLAKLITGYGWAEESIEDSKGFHTRAGHILGTAPYMSPEQARGDGIDFRSDVFSFGTMLYEMVTGRRPFHGDSAVQLLAAIVEKEPDSAADLLPSIPLELERVLQRALQKHPDRRFQSTADLKVELQEIRDDIESGRVVSASSVTAAPIRKRSRAWWVIATALVLIAVATALWLAFSAVEPQRPPPKTIPLTSMEGLERWPALSPDGRQLVFAWDQGKRRAPFQLYLKLVGVGDPLQLTDGPSGALHPAWSADGTRIAFVRAPPSGERTIIEISALGGSERDLGTSLGTQASVSWSPDGSSLAIVDKESPESPDAVFLLSLETGAKRQLSKPPEGLYTSAGDKDPVFSPDGRHIAFVRRKTYFGNGDLYLISTENGEERRLTFDEAHIHDVDWGPEGRFVVFTSDRQGQTALWRIPRRGGDPVRLPVGEGADEFSISRYGHRLAYSTGTLTTNIWRAPGPAAAAPSPPTKIIGSSRRDMDPQYSPDGSRILFSSSRSGQAETWICDSEGGHCELLIAGFNPAWSADGRSVVYCADFGESTSNLYVIPSEGGFARRLTSGSENYLPSWSRSGEWIYFLSKRSGITEIWKIRPDGKDLQRVTDGGGAVPIESPDGRYLYFVAGGEGDATRHRSIWRMPVEGGEKTLALDRRPDYMNWDVWQNSIVFLDETAENGPALQSFDIDSGRTRLLVQLGPEARTGMGLSVSPDGQWVVFSLNELVARDLTLVENFQVD